MSLELNNRLLNLDEIINLSQALSFSGKWKILQTEENTEKENLDFLIENKILSKEAEFQSYDLRNSNTKGDEIFQISILTMKGQTHISFTSERLSEGMTVKNDEVERFVVKYIERIND